MIPEINPNQSLLGSFVRSLCNCSLRSVRSMRTMRAMRSTRSNRSMWSIRPISSLRLA